MRQRLKPIPFFFVSLSFCAVGERWQVHLLDALLWAKGVSNLVGTKKD